MNLSDSKHSIFQDASDGRFVPISPVSIAIYSMQTMNLTFLPLHFVDVKNLCHVHCIIFIVWHIFLSHNLQNLSYVVTSFVVVLFTIYTCR